MTIRIQPLIAAARTAFPALTLAAVKCVTEDDPVLLLVPDGPIYADPAGAVRTLCEAARRAEQRFIVTLSLAVAAPHASKLVLARASTWIEAIALARRPLLSLCERVARTSQRQWRVPACADDPDLLEALCGQDLGSPESIALALEAGRAPLRASELLGSVDTVPGRLVAYRCREGDIVVKLREGRPPVRAKPALIAA